MTHMDFAVALGTTTGRDHRNINVPKNCQDGLTVIRTPSCTVAVVADGCGSGEHSEVGAKIGARLMAEAVSRQSLTGYPPDWQQVMRELLAPINLLATEMGGNYRWNLENYFLFTTIGCLLTDETATFFAVGDGIVIVNELVCQLGPYPNNQPPYASYRLMEGSLTSEARDTEIEVVWTCPIGELESFLIGCDGVSDLISAADKNIPGSQEEVGPISQFWKQDSFFDYGHPDALGRRLRLIARDWPRKNPEPGLLPDDTSLVAGRRNQPKPTIKEKRWRPFM